MREGSVPPTHPLYRGLQMEKALALQRGTVEGREESRGGKQNGMGEQRKRKRCGGERVRSRDGPLQCIHLTKAARSEGHTHSCGHTHTHTAPPPSTPVWWRLFLLQIQLLGELHGPLPADLSSLQTGGGVIEEGEGGRKKRDDTCGLNNSQAHTHTTLVSSHESTSHT